MPRKRRNQDPRRTSSQRTKPVLVDERPWYFRYGYHVGVWSGSALGVVWFAIFQDLIGLIIGIVAGQVAGIILARQGSRS